MEDYATLPNSDLRRLLKGGTVYGDTVAIEMVACYGMSVGKEVFETCLWVGRFLECVDEYTYEKRVRLVYRLDVKMHLCKSARAKDGNVMQALLDKHGPKGTKKAPGPLFGISKHLWAALAVADYAADTCTGESK